MQLDYFNLSHRLMKTNRRGILFILNDEILSCYFSNEELQSKQHVSHVIKEDTKENKRPLGTCFMCASNK
ncbi:hypothetical protein V1478_015432 [Vespula squamosa]|uniref:Uncharacterized protein n=1 Tax=Vespula squamosa TaxID=30214 RepID=A0ABD2A534_VESSQ